MKVFLFIYLLIIIALISAVFVLAEDPLKQPVGVTVPIKADKPAPIPVSHDATSQFLRLAAEKSAAQAQLRAIQAELENIRLNACLTAGATEIECGQFIDLPGGALGVSRNAKPEASK